MAAVTGSAQIGVAVGPEGSDRTRFTKDNAAGMSLYIWIGAIVFIALVGLAGKRGK